MKPSGIVPGQRATSTGQAVAKMVTRLGLEKRAFLVSFNPFTVHAAKQENPNLVIGSFYKESYWHLPSNVLQSYNNYLKQLPGLSTCLSQLPFDRRYIDFLFEKGTSIYYLILNLIFEAKSIRSGIFRIHVLHSKAMIAIRWMKSFGRKAFATIIVGHFYFSSFPATTARKENVVLCVCGDVMDPFM